MIVKTSAIYDSSFYSCIIDYILIITKNTTLQNESESHKNKQVSFVWT